MTWLALLASLQEPAPRDFKPGSWVEMSVLSLRSETSAPRVHRDTFDGPRRALPSFADGLREVSRRDEAWKDRPCVVVEYRGPRTIARAWVVEGLRIPARELGGVALPGDVVKAERVERVGTAEISWTLEVLDLHAKADAAGRTFDCVLEASTSVAEKADGSRCLRSRRRWLSREVPGHVVLQYRQCTNDPAAVPHAYDARDALAAFHVER